MFPSLFCIEPLYFHHIDAVCYRYRPYTSFRDLDAYTSSERHWHSLSPSRGWRGLSYWSRRPLLVSHQSSMVWVSPWSLALL